MANDTNRAEQAQDQQESVIGFITIPAAILQCRTIGNADKLLMLLDFLSNSRAKKDHGSRAVYANNNFMANEIGSSLATVKRHLSKLEELGLIYIENPDTPQRRIWVDKSGVRNWNTLDYDTEAQWLKVSHQWLKMSHKKKELIKEKFSFGEPKATADGKSRHSSSGKGRKKSGSAKAGRSTVTPKKAPWRGKSYENHTIQPIDSAEMLETWLSDHGFLIETALNVCKTTEKAAFGHWIRVLNLYSAKKGLKIACNQFDSVIRRVFAEAQAGEVRKPIAQFNHYLKGAMPV